MNLLFVVGRPPWPARRGDQARVAGLAGQLAADHRVRVVALRPPGIEEVAFPEGIEGRSVPVGRVAWFGRGAAFGTRPVQVALHRQPELAHAVRHEIGRERPDAVVLVLSRLGCLVSECAGRVPTVVDFVDSLALNMSAKAEGRGPVVGGFWRWEGRRMAEWDRRLLSLVDRGIVVSGRDRVALLGGDETSAERLEVVPFGVRMPWRVTRSIRPARAPSEPETDGARGGRPVLLLAGNLGYFPTRDGASWFARSVWPRIREAAPEVEWWLAGSRIPSTLESLDAQDGVRILDTPPDLGEVRRRAAVSVAPLKGGSGTPIKILEAFADGLPVVATAEAAEGLEELKGGEVALADTPEEFAGEVLRLLSRPADAAHQARRARLWLSERHEIGRVADRFLDVVDRAIVDFSR